MNESEKIYEPLLDVETIIPILNRISLFGGLTDNQLYILFRNLQKVKYREGEYIFHQGTPANYIYIVKRGRVRIFLEEDSTILELLELGVGHSFGETSLIGIQPHTASVVALEETELIVLSGKALHRFYKTDTELFSRVILNIARETCRRLAKSDDTLLHFVIKKPGKK